VFHQQHTATQKGNRGGTGLGLYICQQLTQRLGGEISFVSRHREGTTFTVTLPQERAGNAGTPEKYSASALTSATAELPQRIREQQLRLLVVDDSAQARHVIIREARAEFGNAVHFFEAASAAEGLELLLHEHIDLITLDVEMPGMNGFEMLAKLKHNELWRRIPVLMVTVHPDDGRASMLGADGFLSKPVRREELRAAINRVLNPAQSGTVLIVDDDDGCRKDLQRLLEAQGLKVQTAVDGEDAMERIREQLPSLCLIDLLMPRMDGFALIEKLRTMPDTAQIPVFVLSALDLTAEEHRRLAPDVQQFFSKGTADIRAVRTEIQRLLAPRQDTVRTPVVAGVVQ
jgi:CheY-like chemotaxis protein